jgi:transcriptional regulator with XRE-family HTH domain
MLLNQIGADIRQAREAAGLPQQAIANLFGWTRDAISKMERGINDTEVYDVVIIMDYLREYSESHPIHPLIGRWYSLPKRTKNSTSDAATPLATADD